MELSGRLVLSVACFVGVAAASRAEGQTCSSPVLPSSCIVSSLPSSDPTYPAPQTVLVCTPAGVEWNGQLVVYAHGYVPPQEPLALPICELTIPDSAGTAVFLPSVILAQGYAFATTSYHKNGYAIEQAGADLLALVRYFDTAVATADKVIVTGGSEGGLITTMLVEERPDVFSGGLALCGPIGGMPFQIQYLGNLPVVFNYLFPRVFSFGVADVPQISPETWLTQYIPAIDSAIEASSAGTHQLYNVTHVARDPSNLDGPSGTSVESADLVLNYFGLGTPDLVATTGGMPFDNRDTIYLGSSNDFALNHGVERVSGSPGAEAYVRKFYQTTGRLQRPLVTLHTTLDPEVPYEHEFIYFLLAALAGRVEFLTQVPVPAYGHCAFTEEDVVGAFGVLAAKVGE